MWVPGVCSVPPLLLRLKSQGSFWPWVLEAQAHCWSFLPYFTRTQGLFRELQGCGFWSPRSRLWFQVGLDRCLWVSESSYTKCLLSSAEHEALGRGNRAEAQRVAPGARTGARHIVSQVWPLQYPQSSFACCCPSPSPEDSPGRVHGNVRLSWLLFASANLKNVLVFPFGLGSPQQLPFMSIELGTEAVGARGQ